MSGHLERHGNKKSCSKCRAERAGPSMPLNLDVLNRLRRMIRPVVSQYVNLDATDKGSCILMSRIGAEALRILGIPARPMAMKCCIYDAVGFNDLIAGATSSEGSRISYGYSSEPGGWNGHLVLVVGTKPDEYLLDLSVDQVNDLGFGGIDGAHPVLARWKPGPTGQIIVGFNTGRGGVVYGPELTNAEWKQYPDWRETTKQKLVARKLVEAMNA